MSTEDSILVLPEFWLEKINKIAEDAGFTDFTVAPDLGSNHGDGFMATMTAATITGTRSGQLDHLGLICKSLPDNPARRQLFSAARAFEREVYMYNKVLPELVAFQREKNINDELDGGFFNFPKCYFAISKMESDHHVIIMENLRQKGYSMFDRMTPIDFDCVSTFMTAIGRLHGVSFALNDQRPEVFETFREMDDIMLDMLFRSNGWEDLFNAGYDNLLLTFKETRDVKYFSEVRAHWSRIYRECLDSGVAAPFEVIGHGDCWINNLMFNGPNKICMVDWQIGRIGSPVLDVSYFLMSSTTKQLRDDYFNDFIRIYYESMSTIIRQLGSDPDRLITFDDLQAQFKQFSKFGVIMAPMLLKLIVSDPKNIVDMDKFADNLDMNSDESKHIATFNETTEHRYKERVADVINDAFAYGWI